MKKIIRMALVFALAGATLVYTGCTKDYSEDLKSMDSRVAALENDTRVANLQSELAAVKASIAALEKADADLKAAIAKKADQSDLQALASKVSDLETKLQNLYYTKTQVDDLLAKAQDAAIKASKNYTDAEIAKVNEKIAAEKAALDTKINQEVSALKSTINALQSQVNDCATKAELAAVKSDLENAINNLNTASTNLSDLQALVSAIASEIQALAYVPDNSLNYTNNFAAASKVTFDAANYSDKYIGALTFKVTPADAISHITPETATLVAVNTKVAAAPDTLDITYIKKGNAPDYVDVFFAVPSSFTAATFSAALQVEQELTAGVVESVTSDYINIEKVGNSNVGTFIWSDALGRCADENGEKIENIIKVTEVAAGATKKELFKNSEYKWDVRYKITPNTVLTADEAKKITGLAPVDTVVYLNVLGAVPADYVVDSLSFNTTGELATETQAFAAGLITGGKDTLCYSLKIGVEPLDSLIGIYRVVKDTIYTQIADAKTYKWDFINHAQLDTAIRAIAVDSADIFPTGTNKVLTKAGAAVAGSTATVTAAAGKVDCMFTLPWKASDADYLFRMEAEKNCVVYVDSFFFSATKYPQPAAAVLPEVKYADVVSAAPEFKFNDAVKAAVNGTEATHIGDLPGVDNDSLYRAVAAEIAGAITVDSVYVDGVKITNPGFTATMVKDTLKIAAPADALNYNTAYTVYASTTGFTNVKYSWVAPATVEPAPYHLVNDPAYVVNGHADDLGSIQGGVYKLNDIDFSKYYRVNPVEGTLSTAAQAEVSGCTVSFKIFNELMEDADNTAKGMINLPTVTPTTIASCNANEAFLAAAVLSSWGNYTGRELNVRAYLTTGAGAIVDSLDVNITTPNPVSNFKINTIPNVERVAQTAKTVNIASYLYANGIIEGASKNIFSPDITAEYAAVVSYGAANEIKFYLGGAEYTPNTLDYSYDQATGTITISSECALLVAPLKIEVPVYLNHYLDYNGKQPEKATAVITIIQVQ